MTYRIVKKYGERTQWLLPGGFLLLLVCHVGCSIQSSDDLARSNSSRASLETDAGVYDGIGAQGLLPPNERYEIEPRVPEDWVGNELNVSPGTWRFAGRIVLDDPETPTPEPDEDPEAVSVPESEHPTLMLIDDGDMIEIDMDPEDLRAIAQELESRGFADGDLAGIEADPADEEPWIEKGWSNDVDNRIYRGLDAYSANSTPYRFMGQIKNDGASQSTNGGCSGSFIGNTGESNTGYVITAAHCVTNVDTGAFKVRDFWPRQDHCMDKYGNNLPSCDQGPWGEWDDDGTLMIWSYWLDNCIGPGTSYTSACQANDIAVFRAHGVGDATYPGAMGFAVRSSSYLNGKSKYHRGYPNCTEVGDPDPTAPEICITRTLYGDGSFTKDSGDWLSGSYPRRYLFSSDLSKNHSGGPCYYEDSGQYVFGVAIAQTCYGDDCDGETLVNRMRAIDEGTYDAILNYMGL